jgi:adenosylcobyric acid synthase
LHGLFDEPEACAALLAWAGLEQPMTVDYAVLREESIERLADALNKNVQIDGLLAEIC